MAPLPRLVPALALALVLLAGCFKQERHILCEACIERDGQMFCGQSDISLEKEPDSTEEDAKLAAGKAACVEVAARKGGGYSGPPFQQALKACAASVTASDLRRVHCEDRVSGKKWRPQDGV
jgi:hypothetical protein